MHYDCSEITNTLVKMAFWWKLLFTGFAIKERLIYSIAVLFSSNLCLTCVSVCVCEHVNTQQHSTGQMIMHSRIGHDIQRVRTAAALSAALNIPV